MNIKASTNEYDILSSQTVILYDFNSELKLDINASSDFSFNVILQFTKDSTNKFAIEKETKEDTLIFKCVNFNNSEGTGTVQPIPIATVSGKEWYLHFWTYSLGNGGTRKIEYTLLEKNG